MPEYTNRIEKLGLRTREENCLKRHGIFTVEALQERTPAEISKLRGMGPESTKKVFEAVNKFAAEIPKTIRQSKNIADQLFEMETAITKAEEYYILQAPGCHEGQKIPDVIISSVKDERHMCWLRMGYAVKGKLSTTLTPEDIFAGLESRNKYEH